MRTLRKMSHKGDETVAEWDPKTVSPERLAEIEAEFNQYLARGWFAADITDKRDVIVHKFDPQADILLMPKVCGGRR